RKTRSGFPLLASAWPRRRRHHGRRLLSEQLDRRNFDPAFRNAGNPSSPARTRGLRRVPSLVERIDNRRARASLSFRAESRDLLLFLKFGNIYRCLDFARHDKTLKRNPEPRCETFVVMRAI